MITENTPTAGFRDIPTEPDLMAMPCPCCKAAGGFLVAVAGRVLTRRCDVCGGRRSVSRAAWKAYTEAHR
jgi:hypothetical protein